MDREADHSRYAAMGVSPQAVSYMPMGGQGQGLRHQQQGREQSMAHGYEHDRGGGLQGGFTASAAPHTQSSMLGAYRAPDVREGGMGGDAYDAYAIEAGIPSTVAEISMSQIPPPAASKNDSARTLSTKCGWR
jgi:1,6-anhydro-N-acetylmuramate kinase